MTFDDIIICPNDEHPLKAWFPIAVIDDGRDILCKDEQLLKA